MKHFDRVRSVCFRLAFVLALVAAPVAVAEPPDSEVNPVSGFIESVEANSDSSFQVRHSVDPGKGSGRTVVTLSSHSAEQPRIAINADGDTWVVWWHDDSVDGVYERHYDHATESWSDQKLASETGESSRHPEIASDGTGVWIAYEIDETTGTSIGCLSLGEDPEPVTQRVIVRTTAYAGDVDVIMHAESGHAWVTWVDSSSLIGWSEWDAANETWSTPGYESYSGSTVEDARDAIRSDVLGN